MSGPFGNPAMVSSGGGASGPFLTGALEFGTKGTNPENGSLWPDRGLGLIDWRNWFTHQYSVLGDIYTTVYPQSWTYSFWVKGYVSNNWGAGTNFPPYNPFNSGHAFRVFHLDQGSRDHYAYMGQTNTGGTVFNSTSHPLMARIGRSNYYLYASGVPAATENFSSLSNGEMTDWAHIVIQYDYQSTVATGNSDNGIKMWFNGVLCPQYTYGNYQGGLDGSFEAPNPWNWSYWSNGDWYTYFNSWNFSAGSVPPSGQNWFVDAISGSPPFIVGFHGLLANLQIFPWAVNASELGYDNSGVWTAMQYKPAGVSNPYRQQKLFNTTRYDGITSTPAAYNITGELWAASYDFADPVNWHYDNSGNGCHFFKTLNGYNFHQHNYITHTTHDLPPQ